MLSVGTRAERGITQAQLATMIGSSQRALSAYETVSEYPPTAVVVELARVLKVSSDELLGLKPLRPVRAAPEGPEARRLWKKFQQVLSLPEKDRRAVIRLVNSLTAARSAERRARLRGVASAQLQVKSRDANVELERDPGRDGHLLGIRVVRDRVHVVEPDSLRVSDVDGLEVREPKREIGSCILNGF